MQKLNFNGIEKSKNTKNNYSLPPDLFFEQLGSIRGEIINHVLKNYYFYLQLDLLVFVKVKSDI